MSSLQAGELCPVQNYTNCCSCIKDAEQNLILAADQSMGGGPSSLSNKQNMDYDSDSQATELDDLDYFANDIMQQPDDNEDDGDSDLAGPSAFTHDHSNGNHVSMDMHDDLWPADEEEDDDDSPPIGQDMDLEELLAWGSGEIELKGMPTAGTSNSNGIWYVLALYRVS